MTGASPMGAPLLALSSYGPAIGRASWRFPQRNPITAAASGFVSPETITKLHLVHGAVYGCLTLP
jgi:hypothetical protein